MDDESGASRERAASAGSSGYSSASSSCSSAYRSDDSGPSSHSEARGARPVGSAAYDTALRALHLSNAPDTLPGREEERDEVFDFWESCLTEQRAGAMYIAGPPGTGKSATLGDALRRVPRWSPRSPTPVYINAMSLHTPRAVLSRLAGELQKLRLRGITSTFSADSAMRYIESVLCPAPSRGGARKGPAGRVGGAKRRGGSIAHSGARAPTAAEQPLVVVVIDEIDQVIARGHAEVLHSLYELPTRPGARVLLTGIANRIDLNDKFLPHLRARDCSPHVTLFAAYEAEAIRLIISGRVSGIEIKPGVPVMSPHAIELCARKIASGSGDARCALDVCRSAIKRVRQELGLRASSAMSLRIDSPAGEARGAAAASPAHLRRTASAASVSSSSSLSSSSPMISPRLPLGTPIPGMRSPTPGGGTNSAARPPSARFASIWDRLPSPFRAVTSPVPIAAVGPPGPVAMGAAAPVSVPGAIKAAPIAHRAPGGASAARASPHRAKIEEDSGRSSGASSPTPTAPPGEGAARTTGEDDDGGGGRRRRGGGDDTARDVLDGVGDDDDDDGGDLRPVSIADMAATLGEAFNSGFITTVQNLPLHQKIALCATLAELRRSQGKRIRTDAMYRGYRSMCRTKSIAAVQPTEFATMVDALHARNLITTGAPAGARNAASRDSTAFALNMREDDIKFALTNIDFFQGVLAAVPRKRPAAFSSEDGDGPTA